MHAMAKSMFIVSSKMRFYPDQTKLNPFVLGIKSAKVYELVGNRIYPCLLRS